MTVAARAFNFFRLTGDFVHLLSIVLLWLKMSKTRSCSGISLKSQILYLAVYATRYLDLFHSLHLDLLHLYNFAMKCFFIGSQCAIVHAILFKFRASYNPKLDTFRMEAVVVPCLVLALFFSDAGPRASFFGLIREYFWAFSILLESVAILPQMFQLQKTGEAESITTHYLLCLGLYRFFYLLNWIYRYRYGHPPELLVFLAGVLQTALYSDFFYIYYKRVFYGKAFKLPI